jgi:hypothetical protein
MKYDISKIDHLLEKVRGAIGDDRFASLPLMQLEKVIRGHDLNAALPGKTLLRQRIHAYRSARWPNTAPKRLIR